MRQEIPQHSLNACVQAGYQSFYTCQSLQAHMRAEIETLQKLLDMDKSPSDASQDGIDETNAYLADQIAKHSIELKNLERREEFLARRLDHAYRACIRKKLYSDSAEGLLAVCEDLDLTQDRAVLQVIRCTMGEGIMAIGNTSELDENTWKIGIDLTMIECEPELASSNELFGPVLRQHAGKIFANVMMAAYASKLSQLVATDNFKSAIERPLAEKYMRDESFRNLFADTVENAVTDALDKYLPAAGGPDPEKLQKQLNDAQAKLASLKTARDKQTAPLHARIEKLERQNDSLDQELSKLRANNDALLDALAQRDRKLSAYAAREQELKSLPELPGSNIVFAGGHPNMTKKLRQKYPGWTFIEGDEPSFQVFLKQPRIVFFWDRHMSHKTYYRIRKFTDPSVPQAYLKSTNLDMLDAEMRKAWAAAQAWDTNKTEEL